ncbi:MAG TPA: hypothetical protein VJJ82_01705 [Candidatus Nanoarchaeia archaeon]|nr:hypothetical protein [Candidatus Nanoarchaeia archaeon]
MKLPKQSKLNVDLKVADKYFELPGTSLTDLRTIESDMLIKQVERQIKMREMVIEKKTMLSLR